MSVGSPSGWSYEPTRTEAALHALGWLSVVLALGMMILVSGSNGRAFDLIGFFGVGWIVSLGAMSVLARRRAGVGWGGGWSDDALRRTWRINSYVLRPWKVGRSVAVLKSGSRG